MTIVPADDVATVPADARTTVPVANTATVPADATATLPVAETATVPADETATMPATVTATMPAAEPATVPAVEVPRRLISRDDLESFIGRGDQLLRQGDVVSARSFYERAVASGDARAVRRMAMTFDPKLLSELGIVGIRGDAERAAFWYRKADEAAARDANSARHQGQ